MRDDDATRPVPLPLAVVVQPDPMLEDAARLGRSECIATALARQSWSSWCCTA